MAAGLGTLGDQNVRTGCGGLFRESNGLDLADHQCVRALDPLDKGSGIAKRKHDRCRPALQREIEQLRLLRHAPGNEANPKSRLRICEAIELSPQPWFVAISAAQNAQTTGSAYRGGQAGIGDDVHGREQYWMGNSEALG
jgi:hypothetical protein